jgi:hypothetical protein
MTDTMTPPEEEPTPDAGAAPEEEQAPEGETPSMPISSSGIPVAPDLHPKGIKGEIKQIANDYVIPMSDSAIDQWAKAIKGKDTKPFKDYAMQIAIGMYPTFAPQIQSGIPTRVLLDPYIRIAEQVLGPITEEPNWTDPKWSAALQGGTDAKTGRPIPMTLDQWSQYIRQEPGHGWEYSPEAQHRARTFSDALHSSFDPHGVKG